MASEEHVESVEDLIARHLTIEASIELVRVTAGKIGRQDRCGEEVLYRTILVAVRLAREQLAVPRVGTLTFDQAIQAVADGKMVTRPNWGILRALRDWHDVSPGYFSYNGVGVMDWKLDNLDGSLSGSGAPYDPTDEDRAATRL